MIICTVTRPKCLLSRHLKDKVKTQRVKRNQRKSSTSLTRIRNHPKVKFKKKVNRI